MPRGPQHQQIHRPGPKPCPLQPASDNAGTGPQASRHVGERLRIAQDVVREMKQRCVGRQHDVRGVGCCAEQPDVVPALLRNPVACFLDHLGALFDADDAALGTDGLPQQRQTQPGAATHIEHEIAGAQRQPLDRVASNRLERREFEVVDARTATVLRQGRGVIWRRKWIGGHAMARLMGAGSCYAEALMERVTAKPVCALIGRRGVLDTALHASPGLAAGTALNGGLAGSTGGAGTVAVVGAIPAIWPRFHWPAVQLQSLPELLSIAFALTIVALGQSISIAKAMAARSGQAIDANREFRGQGLSNIVGGFFSSYVSCGSLNRSLPNLATPVAAQPARLCRTCV